jgi:solute carrier family 25 phosphate transporter 23/24/25/41
MASTSSSSAASGSSSSAVDSLSESAVPSEAAHPSFTPCSPSLDIRSSEGRLSDPCPNSHRMPSLRDPPGPDLRPAGYHPHHPAKSLAAFRQAEGPAVRAAKLRNLWASLPSQLPASSSSPTPTELAKLPGQGTLQALSPERAERLRRLYEEELVKRCEEERPEARLWGGSDDLEPYGLGGSPPTAGQPTPTTKKGIAWKDFRLVFNDRWHGTDK